MMPEDINEIEEEERFFSSVILVNVKVLALVLGLLSGLAIFVATNWLVIKGGENVGSHLKLLNQYFIGYRVSFLGSLIGFAYAFAIGSISGALIGWIYNRIASFNGRKRSSM